MIYSGDLIKLNGQALPYISEYSLERNKLWKSAERNMAGDVRATLIGVFPKITINTRRLTQQEVADLCTILDSASFSVEYYDTRTQSTHTANYYAGDYNTGILDKQKGLYEGITVNLIPLSRRVY